MPAGLSLRVVALGLAASLLTAAPAAAQSNDQERQDQVIAEVGEDKIYRRDFERAFASLPAQAQQQGRQQLYGRILESLIQQMAVMQAGRAAGLAEDPEVQNRLRIVESQLVSDLYLRRAVENDLTDEKLREAYDQWLVQNPPTEQVRARHILVETEEKSPRNDRPGDPGAGFRGTCAPAFDRPQRGSRRRLGIFRARPHGEAFRRRRLRPAAQSVFRRSCPNPVRLARHPGGGPQDGGPAQLRAGATADRPADGRPPGASGRERTWSAKRRCSAST